MGGCVSVQNRRTGTVPRQQKKYTFKSRKSRKITACASRARKHQKTDNFEFVHVETAETCQKSEGLNLTFHVTQLKWHHSQIGPNGTLCDSLILYFETLHEDIKLLIATYFRLQGYARRNHGSILSAFLKSLIPMMISGVSLEVEYIHIEYTFYIPFQSLYS